MPVSQDELVVRLSAYQDKLEEAARTGHRKFEEVFANPPAGVAVHEFDSGGIRRVNSEELRLLGYTAEQMLGRPIWEFVVMEGVSKESVQKKLAGEKDIKPFVRTFRKADGSGVAMLLFDRRLYDTRGEPVGIRTAMMQVLEG
jgi:PAS domain S-box-containing protein